jgi:hypothetical protein
MNKKKSLNPLGRKEMRRFLIRRAIQNNILPQIVIHKIQKSMKRNLVEKNVGKFPRQVQLDKIDMGNLTPGISVEGFEKETDQRRGKGVYKKILAAMENLRSEGVPFGVSITAMRHNWDLVSSDEFYDFWFNRQDVTPCVFVPYAATNIYDIYKNGGTLDDVLHTCH